MDLSVLYITELLPFEVRIILRHPYRPHFTYLCICWYFGSFHVLAVVNQAVTDLAIQIPLRHAAFSSFVCMPGSGIAGSCDNCMFNFLRNHRCFPCGSVILHFYQHCTRIPFCPHPHQYSPFSGFFDGSHWYLRRYLPVDLIWIFLVISVVEQLLMY